MDINENEERALRAICEDCDDIDGEGFTRPSIIVPHLIEVFDGNGHVAGGYLRSLEDKGLISIDTYDDAIWVDADTYESYGW